MTAPEAAETTFLIDVDNTLLNNDLFQHTLKAHIAARVGPVLRDRYWAIQADLFQTGGYRDYLGAFQRLRDETGDPDTLWLAAFVLDYPYDTLLFPGALATLARLQRIGRCVLLTDGDAVFQPLKLQRAGLLAAAGPGNTMVAVHKEQSLDDIERRFPSRHYVMVDDKLRLLNATKRAWAARVTTVFPRQGQFAFGDALNAEPPADITVPQIADLLDPALIAQLEGIASPPP